MMTLLRWLIPLACSFAMLLPAVVRAEVVSLTWHTQEPFAGGASFGDVGAYDKLVGVARFAVDPKHPRNKLIVDLEHAPRNDQGLVEFAADVFLLRPHDLARSNGAIFYEVGNRGKKEVLDLFNDAVVDNDPSTLEDAGNGYLFRRGYSLLWCGWMGDLLPGQNRMLLQTPVAQIDGKPITGIVRYEMVVDAPTTSMPVSGRGDHGNYYPTPKGDREAVLTWRMRQADERVLIPRAQYSLESLKVPDTERGLPGTLGQVRLNIPGGFRPGYIYELVLEAQGPIVQGLGLAGTRDLISFLKYDASAKNPLLNGKKSATPLALAFGVSQCGRFLRHFVYQGFNADEHDRRVFDGIMPHVAGGGLGFYNHRFAQPSRHNGQHKEHLFPADVFPFAYGQASDEFIGPNGPTSRGKPEGILQRLGSENPHLLPKVMHTQTSSEYWHRSGSLVHTNTLGTTDAVIPSNVRIYVFGGCQHNPSKYPPAKTGADNLHSPGNHRPELRALLDALYDWARSDKTPPDSVYPKIANNTLVSWRQSSTGFPSLPGIRYPEVIQCPPASDLGPRFRETGIITVEPPRVLGEYVVLAPKTDADGNDLGCLRPVEIMTPVATQTGWNLRHRDYGSEGELASLSVGSYLPFPKTAAERRELGDPRLSLEERYGNFAGYCQKWEAACDELVRSRYMLAEDVEQLKKQQWERVKPMFAAEK